MARNRQRSKQRQAERRAKRLAAERRGDGASDEVASPVEDPRPASPAPGILPGQGVAPPPGIDPELAVGAPPQDEGRSDTVYEDEPALDEAEHLQPDELEAEEEAEEEAGYAPRGRRAAQPRVGGEALARGRPRFVQFLAAVWAELQRVQWPDRQALTTLTGVVLFFVLIMGGYLGLLDAIFSRIIQAIL